MTTTMIGQGLYEVGEIARLTGIPADRVIRWATDSAHGPAIMKATFDPMFAFADLVSFEVAKIIYSRGISDRDLRHGIEALRKAFDDPRPLAHERVIAALATSGDSFLAAIDDGDYEDVGKGRQGVFQDIVLIDLRKISFAENGEPALWTPVEGVVINPAVQAGSPCIEGTRIPTLLIADLVRASDPEDVAFDLDLSLEAIKAAEEFELALASGAGLPV